MQHWLRAFRLRTLPLAVSCVGMGGFLAASHRLFSWPVFLLTVLTTILLQILSNLANDYGDSVSGIDHAARKGPSRTVQSGVISKQQMKKAIIIFVMLCLASGCSLLWVSFGFHWRAIAFFFGLGVLCILAAIAYTVGRKPYGYVGLGDVSVLIFFGLVGVMGSYYLHTKQLSLDLMLPALSCGLFSIGVLNINNIRDIESDRMAGKFSIPVRIGKEKASVYHSVLLFGGVALSVIYVIIHFENGWQFLFLLTTPLFFSIARAVLLKPSDELDPYLKKMALTTLLFVVLFGAGLLVA